MNVEKVMETSRTSPRIDALVTHHLYILLRYWDEVNQQTMGMFQPRKGPHLQGENLKVQVVMCLMSFGAG